MKEALVPVRAPTYLSDAVARARAYLVDEALPFWSTVGAYDNGCFVERLDLTGAPVDPGFTRVRVQARQIYVFSHAQFSGLFPRPELCSRAVDFLLESAWLGPDQGWAKVIDCRGRLLDATSDLYDVSFALFALAWRYRVAGDPRCLRIAHETLDFLNEQKRHPAGGFNNDAMGSSWRHQNPHMHFVEAMNAWADASGEERFIAAGAEVVRLFESRFCDVRSGALGEFFNDDWTPAPGREGDIVEPGHQFEWAWILGHFGRLSGQPRLDLMRKIFDFGMRHGFDETLGVTVDQLGRDGHVISNSQRLWPQTEALKACLASAEFLGAAAPRRIVTIVDRILAQFLLPGPVPGTWVDHFDAHGKALVDKVPATSLYHVALAFFELIRIHASLDAQETHTVREIV